MGMNSAWWIDLFPRRLQVQVGVIVSLLLVVTIGLYAWQTKPPRPSRKTLPAPSERPNLLDGEKYRGFERQLSAYRGFCFDRNPAS